MHPTDAPAATDVLLQELTLPCGAVLPGRIAKSAMSEQMGDRANAPSDELVHLYRRWGTGGAGLLITGNVMVDRDHLGEPKNVVVDDDRRIDKLREWATAGQAGGTPVWVQINHPGRQALRIAGTHPVGPSPIAPKVPGAVKPRELTDQQILAIIARFATTAGVVKAAGFAGVQIHGAHGYLVSQFLSPRSNQRNDRWGGDLDGRMRFVVAVTQAIRAAVGPDFPVGIKLNSADFQRGGFTEEESMTVVEALSAEGIDMFEISGGTYEAPAMATGPKADSTQAREAYFLDYAEQVRSRTSVPLMVTGGFRSAVAMRDAISSAATDIVGLGRPFALDEAVSQSVLGGAEVVRVNERRMGRKQLDAAIDLYFHTRQLQRIGAGHQPAAKESALVTTGRLLFDNGWASIRRKRGG